MKRLTIVVGAGGTGSYAYPNIINYYKTSALSKDDKVILIDGDIVESKNLLRQGFVHSNEGSYKAEAIEQMYHNRSTVNTVAVNGFVNGAADVLNLVSDEITGLTEVILISCVDNNLARLRLNVAQHIIKSVFPDLAVSFLDSGNEEWFGQVLSSTYSKTDKSLLAVDFDMQEIVVIPKNYTNTLDNIFIGIDNWQEHLTKGDHEISCDVITESHPQNVATNMTAGSVLVAQLENVLRNRSYNIRFNAKLGEKSAYPLSDKADYITNLNEIVAHTQSNISDVLGTNFYT